LCEQGHSDFLSFDADDDAKKKAKTNEQGGGTKARAPPQAKTADLGQGGKKGRRRKGDGEDN
jgi:hypothetical protein